MKLLLVGNYPPDAQQSMQRFGEMLAPGLPQRGWEVTLAQPRARWRRRFPRARGALAKWLGYLDKYAVFPRELRRAAQGADLVHVVDHSNAVYVPRAPSRPWVVTCHDLLAVRGALGEDTDCPASVLGRWLQRSILAGLARAGAVACVSASTRADLERLAPGTGWQPRPTIPLGQHRGWRRVEPEEARRRLAGLPGVPWTGPFLLHVGSNLRRKNKPAIVRVLARLRETWDGNAVFCGGELTPELRAQAGAAGVPERVFAVPAPTDEQLEAAYSLAHALVYPSKCEGFGWPVIEAQACGCPVICSDRTSLPEVVGEGGWVFALDDEAGMAGAVMRLMEPGVREAMTVRAFANARRFSSERMADAYAALYAQLTTPPPNR